MLLTVDVGNTKTELGLWEGPVLVARSKAPTHGGAEPISLVHALGSPIEGVALASVVPAAVARWAAAAAELGVPFRSFDGTNIPGLTLAVSSTAALGADRAVNALAAMEWAGAPVIAVDLGTATTFDVVDTTGTFRGGAIAPGAATALDALVAKTARLPAVPFEAPDSVIGADTVSAIQAGAILGYASLVEGLVARIRAELGVQAPVIATGGLASRFAPLCPSFDRVDDALTLRGLRRAWELSA